MYFKEFADNSVVTKKGVVILKEGIDHLEALPLDKFIDVLKNLSNFIATEKLDGSNLVFGFTNDGKFYTSRETKGGSKLFSTSDYGDNAGANGFKSAHAALQDVAPMLKQVMDNGEAVEIEVLFGRQPNAIVYGSNYIAFLRMVPGENKEHPDQTKVKKLADVMKNKTVEVSTKQSFTDDGIDIKSKNVEHVWKFVAASYVKSHHFTKVNVEKELEDLQKYLKKRITVGGLELTNMDVMGINLTSVPKDVRPKVKAEREKVIDHVNKEFKLPIKEKFLNEILRKMAPALRDVDVDDSEDTGIEGVVLLDPKTLQQFKLVDKDVFTTINQFNQAIRSEIKALVGKKPDFTASIKDEGDVFGDMLKKIALVIGIPELGKYTSIKRTIRKYVGSNRKETLKNFVNDFKEKDINELKRKVSLAIGIGVMDLENSLEKYKENWEKYELKLKTGKTIKYTESIHKQTLMTFAEVRKDMLEMQKGVEKSKGPENVAIALFGRQIKAIT